MGTSTGWVGTSTGLVVHPITGLGGRYIGGFDFYPKPNIELNLNFQFGSGFSFSNMKPQLLFGVHFVFFFFKKKLF